MQKCSVMIGVYNHLAEGSEESVFEETYQTSWRPFLSVLYRFPDTFAVLHYSGTVLRWLEARHPEFLMLLEEMSGRKQIELLGGAFFSPLLSMIPVPDRLGQIEMLTTYIRRSFGKRPRGCWMGEYTWDSGMASVLQASGFEFTFLPERHFRMAGIEDSGFGEAVMTEDQGKSIAVFPVFDAAESFPSPLPPVEAFESLEKRLGEMPLLSVFYSSREIRSLWQSSGLESPDVFFERAFAALQREGLEYVTTTPSRQLKSSRRFAQAYFSASASMRLTEAALGPRPPKGENRALAQAGSPRRVLLRHEDGLALYARMQYVRMLVSQLRGDKARKKSAQEELWRAQCGDAYWPAPEGGIRLLTVRAAAYSALIEAEKTTRLRGSFSPGIIRADTDFDGEREILYQGADYNAHIHPRGGCLVELDSFRTKTNYVNVMDGQERRLSCFRDLFHEKGSFGPDRGSFASAPYSIIDADMSSSGAGLSREGWVLLKDKRRSLSLRKSYVFKKGELSLRYEIENREAEAVAYRLCPELHLSMGFSPSQVAVYALRGREATALDAASRTEVADISGLRLENSRHGEHIELRSDENFFCLHEAVFLETPGSEEGSSQSCYQGCRLLLGWDMELPPYSSCSLGISLSLRA